MSQKSRFFTLLVLLLITSYASTFPSPTSPFTFAYSTYRGGLYQVRPSGEKSLLVSADGVHKRSLQWSPDQTHLAYIAVEFASEKKDALWIVNANGDDAQLLFGPAKALLYSWEDNRTIYVEEATTFERIPFDKDTIIRAYIIDVKTSNVSQVRRKTDLFPYPIESPDRNKAIWTDPTDGKWTLYLLDSEGNKLSVIYQPPPGRMTNGAWSPNSQRLAIMRIEDQEIYLYALDTREWFQLSFLSAVHRGYRISNIQWSPDGKHISYTLDEGAYPQQICVLEIIDGDEHCFKTQRISNEYTWSRDGCYIAYLGKTSLGEIDIFVVDVYEGKITNLTQDGNNVIESWIAR